MSGAEPLGSTGDARPGAAPPLFVDTCSLLDLVRDPTHPARSVSAGPDADVPVDAAETGRVGIRPPLQVAVERGRHLERVENEARVGSKRHFAHARRIDPELRAPGPVPGDAAPVVPAGVSETALFDDTAALGRARVGRRQADATLLPTSDGAFARALVRMNIRRAPSRENRAEFADCPIIESVFDEPDRRGIGPDGRASVFPSADTADYGKNVGAGGRARGSSTEPRPPLDWEFAARGAFRAATLGRAVHVPLGA